MEVAGSVGTALGGMTATRRTMIVVQHAAADLIFLWSLKVIILVGTLNQVNFTAQALVC
jgi:phosphate starvation-inducible membrane PsiE